MKNYKRFVVLLLACLMVTSGIFASPATSYTYAFNAKGNYTKTQDAYLPGITQVGLGLKEPRDVFAFEDLLYIADTGNNRVVVYHVPTQTINQVISHEALKKPMGVFVTALGDLYVADPDAASIHVFNQEGSYQKSFVRPTDLAFGDTPFKPMKVSVDSKQNMYVIGEGVLNGIIQLSNGGKFLGYFATNRVELNLLEELQDMFFTKEQKKNLQSRVPITITNTFVDADNIVYSSTIGSRATNRLAKHNTAGKNIFNKYLFAPADLSDVYVNDQGIVFASSLFGSTYIYTSDGFFIHAFGGNHNTEDIAGLFSELGSIAVDKKGTIWALDATTAYLQAFEPTYYTQNIYDAIDAFNGGHYDQAEALWLKVLEQNQMLRLAHDRLGKIYLYTQRYEEAQVHLKIANNKDAYSQAFWEERNMWLQTYLGQVLVALLVLFVTLKAFQWLNKRRPLMPGLKKHVAKLKQVTWLQDLAFAKQVIKHPIDAYYDLKIGKKGSTLGASLLLMGLFILYLHAYIGRGFLFDKGPIEDIDFNVVILGYFATIGLFVFTNYLVSSINDGDGTLKQIYQLTGYASLPLILSTLSITLLSYVLTYNEVFIMDMLSLAGLIGSLVLLIVGLQEIHVYTTRSALFSIGVSLGFMMLIAIVALIIFLMSEQVYLFFEAIIREVIRNVTS